MGTCESGETCGVRPTLTSEQAAECIEVVRTALAAKGGAIVAGFRPRGDGTVADLAMYAAERGEILSVCQRLLAVVLGQAHVVVLALDYVMATDRAEQAVAPAQRRRERATPSLTIWGNDG